MDNGNRYAALIKQYLEQHERYSKQQPSNGVETICAFDDERGQYLLLSLGWMGERRVCAISVYARVKDGKVWVEDDFTEEGLATVLIKAGVPKSDIVLAYHTPQMRKLSEFAVA